MHSKANFWKASLKQTERAFATLNDVWTNEQESSSEKYLGKKKNVEHKVDKKTLTVLSYYAITIHRTNAEIEKMTIFKL